MSYMEMLFGIKWLKRKAKIDQHIEALEFFLKSEKNIKRAHDMRQTLKQGMRLSSECQRRDERPKPEWLNSPFEKDYEEFMKASRSWIEANKQ